MPDAVRADVTLAPAFEIDHLPLATAIVEPESGRFIHANHLFRRQWLSDSATALLSLVDPEDRPQLKAMLTDVSAPVPPQAPQLLRIRDADGGTRFAEAHIRGFAAKDAAEVTLYLVQLLDVTAQKTMLDDVMARESRWNAALVSSVSGVWDHQYATGTKYYSAIWRQIRGMAMDDPLPASRDEWLALLHPDDVAFTLHAIARQEAGDPAFQVFEYRERHKDGHYVWIECRGACIERTAEGAALRVVGTDTDITERKTAQHRAAQTSRRLEMALAISGVGVFEADLVSGEVEWDQRMYEIYGVDPGHDIRVGETWESFLHPDDKAAALASVERNQEHGRCFSDQYRILRRDGQERFVRSCSMIFTDTDGHLKLVGANWDITEDVLMQRELERSKSLAEARNAQLETARVRIEHNAMHDYLTGLPNRRFLDEMLGRYAEDCEESGGSLAVLHLDLDRFKQINDTLGHNTGDGVLRHAASVLRRSVSKDDFVARIGGDEFVVLARFEGSPRRLSQQAERIIKEMRKPFIVEARECRVGASIGVAWTTSDFSDAKQVLLNADIALYRAKNNGRNRHEFFSEDIQQKIASSKRIADEILHGLERREFFPVYQLQFDARTLDVCGAETLARWQHPEHGVLSPDSFIPTAEEIDAMATIDSHILEQALEDFGAWQRSGVCIPKLSVNVSYRRLRDPALGRMLRRMPIQPGTLSFELLESTFLDDCEKSVTASLRRIRALGIELEIDDFGTGHASIVSLMRLSPSALKIDRELIRSLPSSKDQVRLVGAIVDIGKSLGVRVIAEGVETMEHAHILKQIGCDYLQGFALARPMPFAQIAPFIKAQTWRQET
ncbi:bifunctional diguanylate cyclase/phosphodiesterase [Rhizobium sp. SSA_523]|uniref:sensor domain-containing protein n=1 Tax=Rhizobium sp. SSA_523 TaxID=2952477 RepID=UPI002090794B|nr:bifunctional diguanylate cyclase/phosphodiesterase [Rhizobium sp. SSA_523]MCO5729962.1 EAL domain-containing protein [Rhizobium sp. SSA_523]WKC25041.1 EAL domain-containing protein [Rhizobium sp. SSA_523]